MEKIIYEFGRMEQGHYIRDTVIRDVNGSRLVRERLFNGSPAGAVTVKINKTQQLCLKRGGKASRDLAEKLIHENA